MSIRYPQRLIFAVFVAVCFILTAQTARANSNGLVNYWDFELASLLDTAASFPGNTSTTDTQMTMYRGDILDISFSDGAYGGSMGVYTVGRLYDGSNRVGSQLYTVQSGNADTSFAANSTVAFWVKLQAGGGTQYTEFFADGNRFDHMLLTAGSNSLNVYTSNASGDTSPIAVSTNLWDAWHFLTITCNDGTDTRSVYVDGQLMGVGAYLEHGTPVPKWLATAPLNKSTYWSNNAFDNMSVWNRALTDGEVLALYHNNGVPDVPLSHLVSLPGTPPVPTLDFGTVATQATMNGGVSLVNDGDHDAPPATLTGGTFSGDYANHFSFVGGDPFATIAPGDSQTFDIKFDSAGLPTGTYETDLTITTDLDSQPSFTYHFTATVSNLTVTLLSYPDAGSTLTTLDESNAYTLYGAVILVGEGGAGYNPAILTGATFSGDYANRFSLPFGDPYAAIFSGGYQAFDVHFDPTGLADGIYTSDLTITTDLSGQPSFIYHMVVNVTGAPTAEPVAEPAGLALLGLALLGLRKTRS